MGKSFYQRGVGHLGLILGIVVVLALGGIGWWVWDQNQKDDNKSAAEQSLEEAVKNAKCDYEDKDLCKFLTAWKANDDYTITSEQTTDGKTTTMAIQYDGKDRTHIKVTGGDTAYEVVTIGNDTYTLAGNGTWYKQTTPQSETPDYNGDVDVDFSEPDEEGSTVSYKKVGTEACGDRTCLKYEVVDTSTPDTKQFLWFDTEDFLLRKMETTSPDGSYTATFDYDEVTISVPSPTQDLGPNQYLVPGANEPTTLPGAGDLYQ
jgi:outer membrane lipoprotein-sorting protein/nitrogen fixation-related uncharacterized protein